MDEQPLEKPHSATAADGTPSAVSGNSRSSSHISESTKVLSYTKVPQDSARGDRQVHPTTIVLRKSQSSPAALVPEEHQMFTKEHYEADDHQPRDSGRRGRGLLRFQQIPPPRPSTRRKSEANCLKLLQDLNASDPLHMSYVIKKIKIMAYKAPNLVLETIYNYFIDNMEPQISTWHKFRLLRVMEAVIGALDSLEVTWEKTFMQLALENMTKSTDLEDVYQDAAGDVLVAICRHSWRAVAQLLETEVLTGVFPHRSLFYVMSTLTFNEEIFSIGDKACWEEQLDQMAVKSVPFLNMDVWSKDLLCALTKPNWTQQEQPPEKAFLFSYYGRILQAEENSTTVRKHLLTLLETSHQWPKQREGMALTVGLAAVCHLDHVWAVLEQFGRSKPIKWSLHSLSPKNSEDFRWKWASSTILLAYGQMAAKAKAHILPWVDNILSRMVYYFQHSPLDETLKQSFLTAVLMLVEAISRDEGAHSYTFSQISELLESLMVLLEKEPRDTLCTPNRQQTIHIISSLCKLRPPPDPERKSRLLSTCLRSVLALPPLDVLEKDIHLSLEMPDVQTLYKQTLKALDQMLQSFITQNPVADELYFLLSHLYVWLASEKTHERQRAAYIFVALLKFLSRNPDLWRSRPPGSLPPGPSGSLSALPPGQPKEDFKRMGQLVGMLGILCQDPDRATQSSSLEGLGHLYWLLMRQREETSQVEMQAPEQPAQPSADGAPVCSSGDQKAAPPSPRRMVTPKDHISELDSSQVIKKIMKYLTVAELTDLIWTAIDGLGSTNPSCVQAAADMLLVAIQEHGAKLETVASLSRAIHLQLYSIRISQAKENALRAITLLAQNHTPELVAAFLDFSIPLDSLAFQLWRALGAELPVSRLVLALLMAWLRERPLPTGASDGSPQPQEKTYLRSLAAMNTLHKLQLAREFRRAVQEAYPALLLALLTQMHYVLELQLPARPPPGQEAQEAQEVAAPSPQSTSLEALKSLLSTTGHWQDFAHLELLGAWELFTTLHTYPQGVGLLARAMVQNCCKQIQAVIGQLLPSLQCREERERKVAILILTEFLYSPALLEVLPQQAALMVLARSLRDPSPEVRVLSLQGLGNILFHPEKGSLLRAQLPLFLDGFFQNSEPVVLRIMGTLSDALHCLGLQGAGAQSLSIAINARSFFDDERDGIRAAAMALFGDLVATMAGRKLNGLQAQVHQSMVPLLLHLRDHCPAVVTQAKFTFYRCAMLLPWRLRHTLFCTLAWERGLSARHFLWTCLMTRSQEEFGIHLAQALSYLHSRHRHIKIWAALFLGYTICYHPRAVSRMVNYVNANLLFCTFQELKKDQEPGIREFATRQLFFLQAVVARRQ